MKGIVLAGGSGTRLYPATKSVSKHLLPIFDKPMIYYPLSCLMLAGIRDVIVISTPRDIHAFSDLFGTGEQLGMDIQYAVQDKPQGIAQAFLIARDFIGNDSVTLILGDNIFYGTGLGSIFTKAKTRTESTKNVGNENELTKNIAIVFAYYVENPRDFGVVEFDINKNALSIEEKPQMPKSHYAVPGIYFYDNSVIDIARNIKPSLRGELEISSVNQVYLEKGLLSVELLGRGIAWLDTGTCNGLMQAAAFVEAVQKRTGMYIACIEEIAWRKQFISTEQLLALGRGMEKTEYGSYLLRLPYMEEC